MSKKIEALRGMEDILPGEIEKWQWLEQKAHLFFQAHLFREIRTPLLEYTELFSRSIGEATDIVHKEMFSFEDRGGRNVTLRPEMTASVARAVIEKGLLSQAKSLRFYYIGPMFRAERPQAGRKRQFHQIGVELINEVNTGGFNIDFFIIYVICKFLQFVGLENFKLRLNDLGSLEQQKQMAVNLKEYFGTTKLKLCSDCQYRLEKNVLRILDCKNEACQPVIDAAPWEKIAPVSKEFEALVDCIKPSSINFEINRRLVRGLDYYNGTVFEISAPGLGSQDALAGGGRYDRLFTDLGGKPTPSIGFSIGMERLLLALGDTITKKIREDYVYLVTHNELKRDGVDELISQTINDFWNLGIKVMLGDHKLKIDDHLKYANKLGLKHVVILGSEEFDNKQWKLKDMDNRSETFVEWGKLFNAIKQVNV